MHTVISMATVVVAALLPTAGLAQKAPPGPDNRYQIRLLVDGVAVRGSQELEAMMVGKSRSEQDAIQAEPIPRVRPGQVSQLIVSVAGPDGVWRRYTRGPRVTYETFECLEISSDSVMTVPPAPVNCSLPEYRVLFVFYNDKSGKPISYSEFVFKVVP